MAGYKLSQPARNKLLEIYEYSLLKFGERQAELYYADLQQVFFAFRRIPCSAANSVIIEGMIMANMLSFINR